MSQIKTCRMITALFFSALIFTATLNAQSLIIKDIPHEVLSVDFRFIHPFYKKPNNLSLLSGIYDLNISVPLGGKWNLNVAVPFVVFENKIEYPKYSYPPSYEFKKNSIGNIYLGIQSKDVFTSDRARNFSLGVFLPTAEKKDYAALNANLFGLFTNYYDLQKYMPETITLYANIAFRWFLENKISLGLDAGPQYLMNISEKSTGQNNFFFHYGFSAGIDINEFKLKSEFSGIMYLTGSPPNFFDRFINFFAVGAGWTGFRVQPSIFYQFNLDKMFKNTSPGSLGIKLSYVLD